MANAKEPVKKTALFDRVIKPQHITLANGHTVDRPRSRMPLIILILLLVIWISMKATGFDPAVIARNAKQFPVILGQILRPNLSYIPKSVIKPLIETIQMSVTGTFVGCAVALPVSILSSSNINHNRVTLGFFRFILAVLRSVPTVIYALVLALIFALGAFAGTAAISLFTLGIVAKMMYESVETIDMGPFEAMQSFGATTFQSFWTACMPQILPTYLDNCLYCFELNVRASAILGYVGAGGIGLLINDRVGFKRYQDVGAIIFALFIVVFLIDLFSDWARTKLK